MWRAPAAVLLVVAAACGGGGPIVEGPAGPVSVVPPPTSTDEPAEPPPAVRLFAADHYTCALAAEALTCWGAVPSRGGEPARTLSRSAPEMDLLAVESEVYCLAARGARSVHCFGAAVWMDVSPDQEAAWQAECDGDDECFDARENERTARLASEGVTLEVEAAIVDISARESEICALTEEPAVECWSTLDDQPSPDRRELPEGGTALALGGGESGCVVLQSKRPFCWGQTGFWFDSLTRDTGFGSVVPGLADAREVTTAGTFSCLLRELGVVQCQGQLEAMEGPYPIEGLPPLVHVAAGTHHACGVDADGGAWCWGRNDYAGLGDGTTVPRETPVQVRDVSSALRIAVGRGHTCALLRNGAVQCWGRGDSGQLGAGVARRHWRPMVVDGLRASGLVLGGAHACARTDAGWRCWGGLRDARIEELATPRGVGWPSADVPVDRVHFADGMACVADNRKLVCGTLPDGRVRRELDGFRFLHTGSAEPCGLRIAGTVACGGDPVFIGGVPEKELSGVSGIVQLSATASIAAVRTRAGTVHRFRPRQDPLEPVVVSELAGATSIVTVHTHVCGLLPAGRVRCVGTDGVVDDPAPSGAVQLVGGQRHACVRRRDGTVFCFGRDDRGQLARAPTGRWGQAEVEGLADVVELAAAGSTTCARRPDGSVACWGRDDRGQLGHVPGWVVRDAVLAEGVRIELAPRD